jgi:hypothetical protein
MIDAEQVEPWRQHAGEFGCWCADQAGPCELHVWWNMGFVAAEANMGFVDAAANMGFVNAPAPCPECGAVKCRRPDGHRGECAMGPCPSCGTELEAGASLTAEAAR